MNAVLKVYKKNNSPNTNTGYGGKLWSHINMFIFKSDYQPFTEKKKNANTA